MDRHMTNAEAVTLKDYIDMRFSMVEKAREEAFQTMEKRLGGMNEFRDALRDQAARFVTREELAVALRVFDADIRVLQKARDHAEGKASQASVNVTMVLAVAGIIISLVRLVIG